MFADRRAVWRDRLTFPASRHTVVAEQAGALVGFGHVIPDHDQRWGALVENVHVAHDTKRCGVGTQLMAHMARWLVERRPSSPLHLWVLEQNTPAQAFYRARGGQIVERAQRGPFPGGGTAFGLRVGWDDPSVLVLGAERSEGWGFHRADDDTIVVRPAKFSDLEALDVLYSQLAEERPEALPARGGDATRRFADLSRQPHRVLLVAERDHRVVATADLLIIPNLTHDGRPWAIIENVVVEHHQRREGIGRALMAEIVRRCDQASCYKIQLLSRKHRLAAHGFYASIGFEPVAEGFRRYLR